MVNNFIYQCPTKIFFGINQEEKVGEIIKSYGFKKVLFHYGKGSILKTGLYDKIVKSLEENEIDYIELGGVNANPEVGLVREGVELARKENIDFVLAVGGGSVIDSAKAIANGFYYDGDVFDLNRHIGQTKNALKVGVVLTISAAGSEMSTSCVISDYTNKIKSGFNSELNRPLFAIMNPELTYTVSRMQTAYGIVDIISHTFERYFNHSDDLEFADYIAEGLLKSVIAAGKKVMEDPNNYDARATLMIGSSYSHNGLTSIGKPFSFPIHQLEHALSGYREDIAHGAGLAILIPAWMKVMLKYDVEKLAKFARNVLNVTSNNDLEAAEEGIKVFEEFIKSLYLPLKLSSYGVKEEDIENYLNALANPVKGFIPLTRDLAKEIYLLAL